jgi:hypothetical protein
MLVYLVLNAMCTCEQEQQPLLQSDSSPVEKLATEIEALIEELAKAGTFTQKICKNRPLIQLFARYFYE